MKKGICFGCLAGNSVDEKLQVAKDVGFDGVEVPGTLEDDEVLAIKEKADALGLEVPSFMGGKHWSHPLSSPDPEVRKECSDAVIRNLKQAQKIGADAVLLVPAVVNADITYEEAWERSMSEVKQLAPVAEETGVIIAIENVWNKFLLSPIEFTRYVDEVNSSHVKAYFDCGNIVLYGEPHHWLRSLGSRIAKIHVKGFTGRPNIGFPKSLESDVPWQKCREAWLEIGYDDYLTVEIGPDPEDPMGSMKLYSEQLSKIIVGDL